MEIPSIWSDRNIERIKKLLRDYEAGKFFQVQQQNKNSKAPVETYVAKVTSEVSAYEDGTIGDGEARIQTLVSADLENGNHTITVYSYSATAIPVNTFINVVREPISGKYFICQGGSGAAIFKGKALAHILYMESGEVVPTYITEECEEVVFDPEDEEETPPEPVTICNFEQRPIWKDSVVTYYAVGPALYSICSNSSMLMVCEADYPSDADNDYADFQIDIASIIPVDGGSYPLDTEDEEEEPIILEVHNPFEITVANDDKVIIGYSLDYEKWVVINNLKVVASGGPVGVVHGYVQSGGISGRSGADWGSGLITPYKLDATVEESEDTETGAIEVYNKSTIAIPAGASVIAIATKTDTGSIYVVIYRDCDSDEDDE